MGFTAIMVVSLSADFDKRPAREYIIVVPGMPVFDGFAFDPNQTVVLHVIQRFEFEV